MTLDLCPLPSLSLPRCELTDLPRLLCGCEAHARWNAEFDFDDLEPAEHEYLTAKDQHPAFLSMLTTSTVKALPEYQAEPWQQARNVAVPTTGSTCESCGNRPAGDQFVCPECLDDLRVHLCDVPGLLNDLDVLGNRESRVTTRPRETKHGEQTRWDHLLRTDESGVAPGRMLAAKGYNRPLHVERAVKVRDAMSNEITTAVRAITEARGLTPPSMDTRAASRWLLGHLGSIAMDPAGADICRGLRAVHKVAQDVIDNVEEGVYLGLCDDPKCRAKMYADPEEREHRCTTCGATYDVWARREGIRDRVRERLLTAQEIVDLSSADRQTFGTKITAQQVAHWSRAGRLPAISERGGFPTYRAGDVVEIVNALIESRDDALPLAQVADLLDIPVKTLYRWESKGLLTPTNAGQKRGRTYDVGAVRVVAHAQTRV